jgi:hypothetical protein
VRKELGYESDCGGGNETAGFEWFHAFSLQPPNAASNEVEEADIPFFLSSDGLRKKGLSLCFHLAAIGLVQTAQECYNAKCCRQASRPQVAQKTGQARMAWPQLWRDGSEAKWKRDLSSVLKFGKRPADGFCP